MNDFNWDDLRVFLAVARAGRLSASAQRLNRDQSTIARRIDRLEKSLDTKLFFRSTGGVALTARGMQLLDHAERAESRMIEAGEAFSGDTVDPSGIVRIATPEAFGSWLIAGSVGLLAEQYPNIQLELIPSSQPVSLSKREADLVVSLHRPQRGRLMVRKLSDYRLSLYASRGYIEQHGVPASAADLDGHRFVGYIDDLLQSEEFRYLRQTLPDARIVFRSSSIVAQQQAVANGLGIGFLHHFLAGGDDRLIPILPELEVQRTYWVLLHKDQQSVPRIRAVLAFLDQVMQLNRPSLRGGADGRAAQDIRAFSNQAELPDDRENARGTAAAEDDPDRTDRIIL